MAGSAGAGQVDVPRLHAQSPCAGGSCSRTGAGPLGQGQRQAHEEHRHRPCTFLHLRPCCSTGGQPCLIGKSLETLPKDGQPCSEMRVSSLRSAQRQILQLPTQETVLVCNAAVRNRLALHPNVISHIGQLAGQLLTLGSRCVNRLETSLCAACSSWKLLSASLRMPACLLCCCSAEKQLHRGRLLPLHPPLTSSNLSPIWPAITCQVDCRRHQSRSHSSWTTPGGGKLRGPLPWQPGRRLPSPSWSRCLQLRCRTTTWWWPSPWIWAPPEPTSEAACTPRLATPGLTWSW